MSDFDEPSLKAWEQRRKARKRTSRRRERDDAQEQPETRTTGRTPTLPERLRAADDSGNGAYEEPHNPNWRRERATSARARHATGAIRTSPQEFQLWMQKGGWVFFAVGAVLIIAALIFLLMQSRGARSEDADPLAVGAAQSEEGAAAAPEGQADAPLAQQPTLTPEPAPPPTAAPEYFAVTGTGAQGLRLRAEPNLGAAELATLPDGTTVEKIGDDSIGTNFVWRQVRTPDGTEGWVAVDWLQPAPAPTPAP
jgi:hypothetical protein